MRPFPRLLLAVFGFVSFQILPAKDAAETTREIAAAQKAGNETEVKNLAKAYAESRGEKAGIPDEESQFVMPDEDAIPLVPDQIPGLFNRALGTIKENGWWKEIKNGSDCQAPLRAVASVVEGCLIAREAGCEEAETLATEAKAAADFLIQAQTEAGQGCYPFPGWRGKRGKLGVMADQFLKKAEAAGKTESILKGGWIMDDLEHGDLYFDTGLAGCAVIAYYEFSKEEKYLKSAEAAAAWAMARSAVPNWNYNSFLVQFFSAMHHATKDPKYLEAAKSKAKLGILPGQLTEGPRAGRWADPHNARLVYHFILLRGLTTLILELPKEDPDRAVFENALKLGLKAGNPELITNGGTNPDTTLDVYCRLLQNKNVFEDLIIDTESYDASRMIFRAVVEEFKNEHATVSPGTWARYLKLTSGK